MGELEFILNLLILLPQVTVSLKLEVIDTIDTCWSLVSLVSETKTSLTFFFHFCFCGSLSASFFVFFFFMSLSLCLDGTEIIQGSSRFS